MLIEIALLALTVWIAWSLIRKPSNYPPGPWGLPLIGHIPRGLKVYEEKLKQLKKNHGDIVSWRFGTQFIVFLFNYKTIKSLMALPELANRPDSRLLIFLEENNKNQGIISSNGTQWINNRRFTLRHLRDMGMGKSKLFSAIQHEADEFVADLKNYTGRPTTVPVSLTICVLNVIWQLVASKRYEFDDEEIQDLDKKILNFQKDMKFIMVEDFFPWIKYILPGPLLHRVLRKQSLVALSEKMNEVIKKLIEEHEATIDENSPRDYIDMYLLEMKKQATNPESTMSVNDLTHCISDLFEGGTETTNGTIHWAIIYMATHQNVQKKLQLEIDEAITGSGLSSFEDKSRLPYTEAFIHELLRCSSLAKNGAPHTTFTDLQVDNYVIPKGAIVLTPYQILHFDSQYFKNPYEFSPERFLSPSGKFETPKEGFFPFGTGKRQCLGESLSRMELMIFTTTLVRNFHFEEPAGMKIDLEPAENPLINLPKENKVLITKRGAKF